MNEPRKPMNDDELDELLARARRVRPDTGRAEYAFETRLMARLREESQNSLGLWGWRLAPWFAAAVVALGVFSWGAIADFAAPDSLADWFLVQMLVVS